MAIFDFIKKLLGLGEVALSECPHCGFGYGWNGRECSHCDYPNHDPGTIQASGRVSTQNPYTGEQVWARPNPTPGPPVVIPRQAPIQPTASPRSTSLTGLDNTERFTPLSTEQALSETSGQNWRTAYLDPLNVIPPANLPRIQVIDRTMIGLGLITGKELELIHEVGEEYLRFKGTHLAIESAGEKAVQESREEKLRRKQQKKAEAAARKLAHTEAVKERRANDIVFLGRGVSKGLADRRAHIEKLQDAGLPALTTPFELAKALSLKVPKLRWLAYHNVAARRVHYVNFEVPKKSGGTRKLSAPHRELAKTQRWILENVLEKISIDESAHGFVKGRSIVTNAQPHVNQEVVINVDLKDFFPTISFWRVEGLFRAIGYSPAVATILALLCTECPRETVKLNGQTYHVATGTRALPQGACTSPAISNLIARHLDLRLKGMAKKLGWNYSRYADDISFSASKDGEADPNQQVGYVLARIRHIADDEGFQVNESKTRVQRNHTQQSVTGVVVNDQMSVDRKTIRKLRAILHNAKKSGLESQNHEQRNDFAAWLNGMISYVEMVNGQQGAKLRKSFHELTS